MIARRGPKWWHSAIIRGSRLLVLDFDELIGGYASYGRNRVPALPYRGEINEVTFSGGADLPVYLRITQSDGHQAWSSPIYLIA